MDIKNKIKELIESNISIFDNIEITNSSGTNKVNIKNYLIDPRYEEYIDLSNNNKIMLWTVYEGENSAYKIVYSEKDDGFGLALISEKNEKIYFGNIGSFLEALFKT